MVGGTNKRYDLGRIKKHGVPAILVATPGQLLAHLRNSRIDENTPFAALFKSIQTVAIDEADKLLDMGFSEDICEILSFCPPPDKRQTLLFSATFSQKVNEMVKYACKPDVITIDCVGDKEDPTRQPVPEKVDQSYVTIPMSRVFSAPIEVVANLTDNKKKRNVKIIAFFPTRHHVQLYEDIFNYRLGRRVLAIHKEMPQSTRTSTSDLFRHAKNAVLLTTGRSRKSLWP